MGLSDQGGGDPQMKAIMDGGENWMARMTALLKAKEDAEASIAKAKIVGEISDVRNAAEADRATAVQELANAKDLAARAVDQANEKAQAILDDAHQKAADLLEDAGEKHQNASKILEDAEAKARKLIDDASSKFAAAEAKNSEVAKLVQSLGLKAIEADKMAADAEESKKKFDDMIDRLKAAIADVTE